MPSRRRSPWPRRRRWKGSCGGPGSPRGAPRRPRRRSRAATPTPSPAGLAGQLELEDPGHAHAVLVHGEALVGVGRREGAAGEQVVLVGGEGHPSAEDGEEHRLPVLHRVDDGGRLLLGVGPHRPLGGVPAHAQGHHADGGQLRILVEHAGQGVVEDGPVVHPGAHHHLAVDLDAGVEQGPQPAQAGGSPPVAQHPGADLGVGGVDAHVDRAQALGDHPFEVELGEAGEGGVVAVEERQAIVVVLHVQAGAQALGQLVDEAELAVVVARPHLVEQGG